MNSIVPTQQAYRLLHDGSLAFARAEQAGIRIDLEYTENKKAHLTRKIERLEDQFKDTKFYRHWANIKPAGPNIYSNQQLAHFLYRIKKLETPDTTRTGQGSTSEETLRRLNIPELENLIQIRKLKKIRDTYLDAFLREQVNGYIHPSFNLHLVRTYRSSSNNPNFQNIPKRDHESMQIVRKAIYPRPGHQLFSADFSGLEVRIAACYHEDPTMMKYLNNPASDMHGDMAEQLFLLNKYDEKMHKTLRDASKNGFVFPEFYGDWYKSCAENLACNWGKLPQGKWKPGQGINFEGGKLSDHMIKRDLVSFNKFTNHVKQIEHDFWTNRFPRYAQWKEEWWDAYREKGYFDLLTGFRCSGIMNKKEVINYPVQGSAFHCLLWSFIETDRIARREKWDSRIIGQIHDEIVLDINPDERNHVAKTIQRITCEDLPKAWDWITVPLEIEMDICPIDGSWADKERFCL